MSTTEGFEGQDQDKPAHKPGAGIVPPLCEARDLKGLLDRIADQIADADRRHSAALGSMHDRLADLARGAIAAREEIEGPVPVPGPAMEEPTEAASMLLTHKPNATDDGRLTQSEFDAGPAEGAPAALRSALGDGFGGSFTRKDEPGGAYDPFDVVGLESAGRDDEPWDRVSAEALTRIYENEGFSHPALETASATGETLATPSVAAVEPAVEPTVEPAPAADAAAIVLPAGLSLAAAAAAMATQPAPTAREDIERAWLEAKFADVATKLEQSLESLRPDGSVLALEQRLERLELKLGEAMADAATRSDLAGLKSIETQVEELALQLDTVQAQFARLGDIETELRALGVHVSDERMTKLVAGAMPPQALPDELAHKVAQQVAAQVVANLPRPSVSAGGGDEAKRMEDLRAMVHSFITEQRQGDEQTVTMLDTMQQAMIRLLDRMDALETGTEAPHYPTYDEQGIGEAEQTVQDNAAYGRRAVDDSADLYQRESHRYESTAQAAADPRHNIEAPPLQVDAPLAAEADVRAEAKKPQAAAAERASNAKEDFIASARRAAKQAAEAKAEEEAEAAVNTKGRLAGALAGGKKSSAAAAGAKRGPSKIMLAVLAVFALGASFTIVNAVMKMTKPPIERRINVTPPDIMERDDQGGRDSMIDRDGEPGNQDNNNDDSGDTKRDRSQRSGEPAPRMIAPDVEAQRKLAGTSGHIVDDTGRPVGIVLQHSAAISRPEHVMRLEEQQNHAALSARLGALQRPAPAVPAAMVPDTSVLGTTIMPVTRQDGTGLSARTVNEMPPAFIGPTSLRQAAAKGDPSAEFEVGARFAEGKGLQQDLKQAVAWYQRSAAQGFAQAQYRLATMFERGLGVKMDLERAKVWYLRAADQGTAKAMHNLAVLSTGREGVPADYTAAAQWFAKAAAYGLVDSQFNLAVLYDGGLGVQKDVKQAYKWYALAAKSGDDEALRRQDALRGKLAAAELVQVTGEIESWRPLPVDAAANDPRVAGERWKLNVPVTANQ